MITRAVVRLQALMESSELKLSPKLHSFIVLIQIQIKQTQEFNWLYSFHDTSPKQDDLTDTLQTQMYEKET